MKRAQYIETTSPGYWQKRCEAAENYIYWFFTKNEYGEEEQARQKWQALKSTQPENKKHQETEAVLNWLLEIKSLPTGIPDDFYEDKIIICDGAYYWESDKDGEHPMMGKDVMEIYEKLKQK